MQSSPYALNPESELSSASFFEHNPLPCYIIDGNSLKIISANKAALHFYGYGPDEFRSIFFTDLHTPANRVKIVKHLHLAEAGKSWSGVFQQYKKNKELVTVELYVHTSSSGDVKAHQITAVDISYKTSIHDLLASDRERYKVYIEQSAEAILRFELKTPIAIDLEEDVVMEYIYKYAYVAECNQSLARMYGFNYPAQLEGRMLSELYDISVPANKAYLQFFIRNNYRLLDAESCEKRHYNEPRYFLNNLIGIIENGYLKRIWGTQRDVTGRKIMEQRNRFLASLVENTSDVLTSADLQFKPLTWNAAAERIYGLKSEQVIGKDLREFIDLDYNGYTRDEVRRILQEEGEWRGEMFFRRPTDHRRVTLLTNFTMMRNEEGIHIGYVIAASDITERIESEFKLRESETRFRDLADSAPVMIWISDTENKAVYVNRPLIAFLGMDSDQIRQQSWISMVHQDDIEKNKKLFDDRFRRKQPVTLVYRLKNTEGEYRWVQDAGLPRFLDDGTFIGYIGSIVDIHDTKSNAEQVRYQASMLENVLDIIVTSDLQFRILSLNKIAEAFFGLREKDAIGHSFRDLIQYDFGERTRDEVVKQLKRDGFWKGEISYTNKKGVKKFLLHTITGVHDAEGVQIGYMAVSRDITDRKEAEEKVQKSEKFYRSLIADSLDGMILTDAGGIITFVSPSIRHILDFQAEEVIGTNAFEYVHPEDVSWALQSFQKEVQENPEIKFIVVRLRKKSGEWIWCMVRGHNLLNNPYVNSIVIYFHDDSLRKKASDALKESEQRFKSLIQDVRLGVMLYDRNLQLITMNKMVEQLWVRVNPNGLPYDQLMSTVEMITEDGNKLNLAESPLKNAFRSKKPVRDSVIGCKQTKNSEPFWVLVNAEPILDDQGEILHVIVSLVDITERKKLEQKLLREQINQQKLLTQAMIDGQEKERKEIGKELHDNIGQQLTTTKLYLDLAKESADDTTREMISLAVKGIFDVINEVRGMSRSLIPPTLGDLGLIDSIQDLVETITRTQVMAIDFRHDAFDEDGLPENLKLMLFRIIQEQLNNIVKHAEASKVDIVLKQSKKELLLEIRDNGKGFNTSKKAKGLGLTNIKNRAELFGGTVRIISSTGKGCILKVTIPEKLEQLPRQN